ncbi:MAG: SDR family oxidoreductase [Planctomycetota bacterium]
MSGRMQDRTAVITGGNSGIGLETARRFVAEGARVAIFGRNQESLDAAVAELGERALAVRGDVTRTTDLERLFTTVAERLGKVDALYANAGVANPVEFATATEDDIDKAFAINFKGAYLTVQAALPHLAEGASVVLTTSSLDTKGVPGMSVYAATKAAVRSLVRSLAAELRPRNIRVNAICPGPVETPIYARMGLPGEQLDGLSGQILEATPAGRFGRPREIADAVVFLASEESSYVLGSELSVDGGFSQL